MKLKELVKEVEFIINGRKTDYSIGKLKGIRKAVESIDNIVTSWTRENDSEAYDYWKKLKKLLGVK